MMLHIALFIISSAGGEGASCRIDADCMGGLGCTTDRVCVQLRAPPPRDDVFQDRPAPRRPRAYRRDGARYDEGEAVPQGAHIEERPRLGLIIGGAVVFGIFWVSDWTLTIASCTFCDGKQIPLSFIPVLGPFLQVAFLHYRTSAEYVAAPFLVIDGLMQGLGAGLLLGGLFSNHKVLVYDGPYGMQGVVTPIAMPGGGAGIATMGTF